jgi:Rps23 Pro-64 3,4-dihydroxylase Tpa1-like proline 4-hydroxylase
MVLISANALMLLSCECFFEPFQYFVSLEGFSEEVSLKILEWLESAAPWKLVETDFYEQYEFDFLDARLPAHLTFLQEESFLAEVRTKAAMIFQAELSERVDFNAHKLVSGQRIRLHNDFIPGQETHRLLIQFNRGWDDAQGGLLIFFNSAKSADIHKVFRPFHNSVVGFAITPNSNHAVSAIHSGERFTLVFSFYKRNGHV